MTLALQGARKTSRYLWQGLFTGGGVAAAIAAIVTFRQFLPGFPAWIAYIFIGLTSSFTAPLIFRIMARRNQPAVAEIVIQEGLCPSCGYNLFGLSPEDDGCLVCPECSAAWRADRVVRAEPFAAGSTEGNILATLKSGMSSNNSWLTTDDRGRVVELANPTLRRAINDCTEPAVKARLAAAKRQIAHMSRRLRVPILVILWLIFGGIAVTMVVIGVTMLRQGATAWFFFLGAFTFVLPVLATRGNFLYSAKHTRRILLELGLCPSCVTNIKRADSGEDGCRVCPRCFAAWKTAPQDDLSTRPLS